MRALEDRYNVCLALKERNLVHWFWAPHTMSWEGYNTWTELIFFNIFHTALELLQQMIYNCERTWTFPGVPVTSKVTFKIPERFSNFSVVKLVESYKTKILTLYEVIAYYFGSFYFGFWTILYPINKTCFLAHYFDIEQIFKLLTREKTY